MKDFTTYESGGMKDNLGKVRPSIFPPEVFESILEVFEYGSSKYNDFNWCKGLPYSSLYSAAIRHLSLKWWAGQEIDDESGLHHLDHAITNLIMLKYYITHKDKYGEYDDRFWKKDDQ